MKKYSALFAIIFLFVFVLVSTILPHKLILAGNEKVTMRIGVMISPHEELKDIHDFNYYISYFDELSKYDQFEYEVVEVPSGKGLEKLHSEEVDIILPVDDMVENDSKELCFTDYPYGKEMLGLFTRPDENRFSAEDLGTIRGVKIGLVNKNEMNKRFMEFCRAYKLELKHYFYKNREELLQGLHSKEVDLVLDTSAMSANDKEKFLIGFDAIPVHMAALKKNERLIKRIDMATWLMEQQNPKFAARYSNDLYENYSSLVTHFTPEEVDFIKEQKPLKIMLVGVTEPLVYYPEGKQGKAEGVYPDLVEEIAKESGLRFEYVYANDFYEAWDRLRLGEADLLIDVYSNVASNKDFKYTNSMYDEPFAFIKLNKADVPRGGRLALPIECPAVENFVNHEFPSWKTFFNADAKTAMKKLNDGEAEAAIVSMNSLQMEKLLTVFPNLVMMPSKEFDMPTNIAIAPGRPMILQFILNKAILRLDENRINHIVLKHTLSSAPMFNISYLRTHYPLEFGLSVGVICIVFFVIAGLIYYGRMEAKQQKILADKNAVLEQTLASLKESNFARDEYKHKSELDSLTGILNKEAFQKIVDKKLEKLPEEGRCHALFILDLDYFKEANDKLGHQYGDYIIKNVADILKNAVREEDAIARFGGDEFLVFIKNIPLDSLGELAARLNKNIREIDKDKKDRVCLSASIGIARMPHDAADYVSLLRYADSALYNVKENGKDNYKIFQDKNK